MQLVSIVFGAVISCSGEEVNCTKRYILLKLKDNTIQYVDSAAIAEIFAWSIARVERLFLFQHFQTDKLTKCWIQY